MDRKEFDDLLEKRLSPIYQAIEKLENSYEKVVDVLTKLASVNENVRHLEEKSDDNKREHDEIFRRLRAVEVDPLKTEIKDKNFAVEMLLKTLFALAPYAILGYVVFSKM